MSISRRRILKGLALGIPALQLSPSFALGKNTISPVNEKSVEGEDNYANPAPFEATRASLSNYVIPDWFRDAKFGIWAHWGPQSAIEAGDWYARNMYIQGQRQYKYHVEKYGHPSKFGYKDTIPAWKAENLMPII